MPTVYNIPLERAVPLKLASELKKRLFYVSNEITDFTLIEGEQGIESIDVTSAPDHLAVAALAAKINGVVKTDILKQKVFLPKVVWQVEKPSSFSYQTDMFEALVHKGIAFESGEGQVGFGEPLIALMDYFDDRVKKIALRFPNAQEYRYPTLLPTHVLEEFGYFASFPQFMMFVTRLHNDLDVYQAFVQEYERNKKITPALFSHCQNHDYCLPPTMCYHTYHQYRGQQLAENRVVTAKGKSFRFEAKYYRGLERLWDFTIREIVFMGTRDFVLESRQAFMQQSFSFMEELGLHGFCEVANDPFFVASDTAGKIFSQRALELKYELRINVAEEQPVDRSIAVASFNFHETFFGETFQITQANQKPTLTGCVGFGLERLVYAFLCQHGLDPAQWPQIVKNAL
ncbi:MAG: hypothetical protein NT075_25800 [Chloroflexi bacterium]|nr:hypothetical protein [Chloroflexota bacterium]